MKKAGEILREARLLKKLSVEEVSEGTKIRPSYIDFIENSEYKFFQSQTSIKGFIKNYATFLNLSPENVIAIYRREQDLKSVKKSKNIRFNFQKLQFSPVIIIIMVVLAIVTSVVGFFTYQYIQVSQPPQFQILEPKDGQTTTQDRIAVRVLPVKDQSIEVRINGKAITTLDQDENIFTIVDLVDGENKIVVSATNGYKKTTDQSISVFKTATPQVSSDFNVTMRSVATKELGIDVTIDNDPVKTLRFDPGKTITFTAKTKINFSGPNNMHNLLEILINQNRINLLPNTPHQQISFDNNKINQTALP